MKILHKILPIFSVVALATTPILTSTSCSCVFELNLTEQEQYIYDRTFSIYGKNDSRYVLGTGWIISDATKDNPDDYSYWLATNWHVLHQMKRYSSYQYYYADSSMTNMTKYIPYQEYMPFASFAQESSEQKFVYSDPVTTNWYPAIDLGVIKVNFGSPKGAIKQKLDKLNQFQKTNGYINKFVKDSNEIRAKNKIIGGYPAKRNGSEILGSQWESHSFGANHLTYSDKGHKFDNKNCGHAIGNPFLDQLGNERKDGDEIFPYWDISPQYWFKTSVSSDFMDRGASGSMMITEDYEVCGIYWGGWEINGSFHPSFSLFNTNERNFLEPYI